ncbi:MAG: methyltransferase domain-containing protein [Flavobacteriaceae bacterium]|nr:methyltransferase domain-containing protein [Flavobacteriaceae bacterium]
MAKQAWFKSWFDSKYYHILYSERNDLEAKKFVGKLMKTLALPKAASLLDVACGRGRHARNLNELGYDVTGIDLSMKSIFYAKAFENQSLRFQQYDMRKAMDCNFDGVLNLFTSFGYFEDDTDSLETLHAFRKNLKPGGVGVLDFLNTPWVAKNLVPAEKIIKKGISFDIKRNIDKRWITKEISFEVDQTKYQFQERVRALTLKDFEDWFAKAGLQIETLYGDYELSEYNPLSSKRLIMIVQ